MEKKELGVGQCVTTGTMFIRGEFKPEKKKLVLSEQRKEAILEYLKGSDEFHKLVCDITGVERKQEKVSQELEKLKEEYWLVCERYKQEQVKNKAIIQRWKDEAVKRMKMQTTLKESCSHHNNMMNMIKDLLKEVDMPSVKHTIEALKTERANGKLVAEECELLKEENDMLSKRFSDLEKSYFCIHKEANEIKNSRKNISANYDRLIEGYSCLNARYNNQKEYIAQYIEENKRLTDKVEKLKGKLDKASKRYSELIKIISDRAIKSI